MSEPETAAEDSTKVKECNPEELETELNAIEEHVEPYWFTEAMDKITHDMPEAEPLKVTRKAVNRFKKMNPKDLVKRMETAWKRVVTLGEKLSRARLEVVHIDKAKKELLGGPDTIPKKKRVQKPKKVKKDDENETTASDSEGTQKKTKKRKTSDDDDNSDEDGESKPKTSAREKKQAKDGTDKIKKPRIKKDIGDGTKTYKKTASIKKKKQESEDEDDDEEYSIKKGSDVSASDGSDEEDVKSVKVKKDCSEKEKTKPKKKSTDTSDDDSFKPKKPKVDSTDSNGTEKKKVKKIKQKSDDSDTDAEDTKKRKVHDNHSDNESPKQKKSTGSVDVAKKQEKPALKKDCVSSAKNAIDVMEESSDDDLDLRKMENELEEEEDDSDDE
jgi:hypothetical protein